MTKFSIFSAPIPTNQAKISNLCHVFNVIRILCRGYGDVMLKHTVHIKEKQESNKLTGGNGSPALVLDGGTLIWYASKCISVCLPIAMCITASLPYVA